MALNNLESSDAFYKKILLRGIRDESIHDVSVIEKRPALKKGENYMSYLTRFSLEYICNVQRGLHYEKVKKIAHLILKEEPDADSNTLEHIRELDVFNIERKMLEEVVPEIEKLVGKIFAPKVYYSSGEPSMIVMEDLVAFGFQNKNRKVGFNKAQVFMVLENLADFHAASILLNERNPGFISRFSKGLVNDKTADVLFILVEYCLASIGDTVRTWPDGEFVSISHKLQKRSKDISQSLRKVTQFDKDELQVLNHGDVWTNNIMIRDNENGKPQDIRFLDYQISVWTSPAIDLLWFLSIAPEIGIKMTHDDIFLQVYLTRLSSTMNKLGCSAKPPTLEELKKSMYRRRAYALTASLAFYPRLAADAEDIEPVEELLRKGKSTVDPLKNPRVREVIKKILPILDERGYLD